MSKKEQRAQRAQDFANQKIKSAKDFNFAQHDPKNSDGKTHISQQEINSMKSQTKANQEGGQQSEGRTRLHDNFAALQAQKEAGANFSGRAQNIYNRMEKRVAKRDNAYADRQAAKEKAKAAQDQSDNSGNTDNTGNTGNTGTSTTNPTTTTEIANSQEQNVNQDNDISNNVSGDNNNIVNNQDNSIRQYGGDNRSLVINNSGGGSLMDSMEGAGTAGTLAGLWDADDSPAAQAKRLDFHQTMNRDAQKKYKDTSHIAQGAVTRAENNSYIDPAALDKRIQERSQYHKSASVVKGGQIFGDLFGMKAPTWNSADPANPVEKPDFEKLSDTYTDF